jgi:hypothetical protein
VVGAGATGLGMALIVMDGSWWSPAGRIVTVRWWWSA